MRKETRLSALTSEVATWYCKAAKQNYPEAQFHLGNCCSCIYGVGVSQDKAAAINWYYKPAAGSKFHRMLDISRINI